jgi:murein endopeptidase
VVQPFYRKRSHHHIHVRCARSPMDLHEDNVGFDTRGRAVAFDW